MSLCLTDACSESRNRGFRGCKRHPNRRRSSSCAANTGFRSDSRTAQTSKSAQKSRLLWLALFRNGGQRGAVLGCVTSGAQRSCQCWLPENFSLRRSTMCNQLFCSVTNRQQHCLLSLQGHLFNHTRTCQTDARVNPRQRMSCSSAMWEFAGAGWGAWELEVLEKTFCNYRLTISWPRLCVLMHARWHGPGNAMDASY